jgi:ATP-dependent Zn protease
MKASDGSTGRSGTWEVCLMNEMVSLLISWLPFLLLIGVWLYFSRRMGMQARGRSGTTMIELYEQQVEETRRMNATLERIAVAMEKQ